MLLPAVDGFEGCVARLLGPDVHDAAGSCAQGLRQRLTQEHLSSGWTGHPLDAMEPPEPVVDAIDRDAGGSPAALQVAGDAFEGYQRHHVLECRAELRVGPQVLGKPLPHEVRSGDCQVGAPEPLKGEPFEAGRYRCPEKARASARGDGERKGGDRERAEPPVRSHMSSEADPQSAARL